MNAVKPKTESDLAGMRVAGRLAAEVLEMIARLYCRRSASHTGAPQLQGISEVDLHLSQRGDMPWHPLRQ